MMNANFNLDTLNPSLQTSRQMSKHYVQMDTRNVLDELLALHYILCKGAEVAQALSSLGGVDGEKNGGEK